MEAKIENQIRQIVSNHKNNRNLEKFEKALDKFDKLIESGMVKRRGNNLVSITDSNVNEFCLNSIKQIDKKMKYSSNL